MTQSLKTYSVQKEEDLNWIIQDLQKEFSDFSIFLLKGELGAGKTTFVKHFIHSFDPNYEVQSPTFTIANFYEVNSMKVLHADLYRLKSEEEVLETGIPDALKDCDYAFIEWFELLLPWIEQALIIQIEVYEHQRIFHIFPLIQ